MNEAGSPRAIGRGAAVDRWRREASRSKRWDWEPDPEVAYPLTPSSSRRLSNLGPSSSMTLEACVEPGWRLRDILLAARLLVGQREQEDYADEAEMRRVYGLVYDVLRYKQILDRTLHDVGFWMRHDNLKLREKVVWLMLYDMQGRKFAQVPGSVASATRTEALKEAGLLDIEKALLGVKTRLAASLSRLRIGGSALSLDELLPAHLRTAEGVTWGEEGAIASGWVNSAKIPSRWQFVEEMRKLGLMLCTGCALVHELEEDQYVFDPLCPKVINVHEKAREKLAVSQLVRGHGFVFMERSLCVGAASLAHAIRVAKLCGPVILTHSLAPRHTGYLVELLKDIEEAGRLLAFGVGDSQPEHQAYLEKLGISSQCCKVFSERYISAPPSAEIDRATIILATPPCSYTGVRDIVDLAIARGGDLQLLESLTSIEAESPQQPRALLAEQMATLRYALTRPNVQLLVYEVHTLLPSETTEMIEQAVDHSNRMAFDKFLRDQPRKKSPTRESTGKKSKSRKLSHVSDSVAKTSQDETKSTLDSEDNISHNYSQLTRLDYQRKFKVPDSDLFEISDLNDLYQKDCRNLVDQGSFIVIAKRKEMMQFNSLFMINVAEAKGVFGDTSRYPPLPRTAEVMQQPELTQVASKKRRGKIQIDRLTVPTHATILRHVGEKAPCPRHQQHVDQEETAVEMQNTTDWKPKITSWPTPYSRKTGPDLHIELSSISNNKELWKGMINDPLINKTVNPSRVQEELHEKCNINLSTYLPKPVSLCAIGDLDKEAVKSSFLFKRSSNTLESLSEHLEEKSEGAFFDFKFKPKYVSSRRQLFPRKLSRLYRIPFKSRLETVVEQSDGFSYLFPQE